jgi:hypothetical protein
VCLRAGKGDRLKITVGLETLGKSVGCTVNLRMSGGRCWARVAWFDLNLKKTKKALVVEKVMGFGASVGEDSESGSSPDTFWFPGSLIHFNNHLGRKKVVQWVCFPQELWAPNNSTLLCNVFLPPSLSFSFLFNLLQKLFILKKKNLFSPVLLRYNWQLKIVMIFFFVVLDVEPRASQLSHTPTLWIECCFWDRVSQPLPRGWPQVEIPLPLPPS